MSISIARSKLVSASPRKIRCSSSSGSGSVLAFLLDGRHVHLFDEHVMNRLTVREVGIFRVAHPPSSATGCPTRILRLMAGVSTRIRTYANGFLDVDPWMKKANAQVFMETFAACKRQAETYPVASQLQTQMQTQTSGARGTTWSTYVETERRRQAVLTSCAAWSCWQIDARFDAGGGGLASWHAFNAVVAWATGVPVEKVKAVASAQLMYPQWRACQRHGKDDSAELRGFDECSVDRMRSMATLLLGYGGQPFSPDAEALSYRYHSHAVRVYAEFLDSMPDSACRYIPGVLCI